MKLAHINLGKLSVSRANMRYARRAPDVADLLPSVRARGVIVPVIVRPNGASDHFEIVAGARRFHAAQLVAKETDIVDLMPCAIMEAGDDAAALEASLLENTARLDASEVKQWESFARLVREGRSVEDWLPRWMVFPPSAYNARGGVGTVERHARIAALIAPVPAPEPPAAPAVVLALPAPAGGVDARVGAESGANAPSEPLPVAA